MGEKCRDKSLKNVQINIQCSGHAIILLKGFCVGHDRCHPTTQSCLSLYTLFVHYMALKGKWSWGDVKNSFADFVQRGKYNICDFQTFCCTADFSDFQEGCQHPLKAPEMKCSHIRVRDMTHSWHKLHINRVELLVRKEVAWWFF